MTATFDGVMLAKKYNRNKITLPCYAQPKLDGVRAIWDFEAKCFYTRNGHKIAGVPFMAEELKELNSYFVKTLGEVNLDGELMLPPPANFNLTNGIVRRKNNNLSDLQKGMEYHIYDFQSGKPFSVRTQKLAGAIDMKLKNVKIVHTEYITAESELDRAS